MARKLRILMIEDSENDVMMLLRHLRKEGFNPEYERVENESGLRKALESDGWDLVISDFVLPQFSGLEALKVFKQSQKDIPFIMVSGKITEDMAIDVMKAGAQDFISKTNLTRLSPAIERELVDAEQRWQRREVEQKLKERERIYRLLADNVSDVIWVADIKEFNCSYISPSVERLLGFKMSEVIQYCLREILTSDSWSTFKNEVRTRASDSGSSSVWTIDLEFKRKDGSTVWAETTLSILREKSGLTQILGVSRDITERKVAEKTLALYQTDLQSLASQLSLAEEKERRRISSELHDRVCAALATCALKLENMRKQTSATGIEKGLREVQEACQALNMETRSLMFQLSPPILYDLGLEPALEELAAQFQEEHNIEVGFDNEGAPSLLNTDKRVLVFQAVRELLVNIVKHSKAKRVEISVSNEKGKVTVRVEDNGVGFDSARNIRGRRGGGFGLFGIRERLQNIGGSFEVHSEPGKGTRVMLSVPADKHTLN